MQGELSAYGVDVVALSKDPPETVARQKVRDGIDFTLLSDPQLKVIRDFGLLHHGALEFGISGTIFGVPLAIPTGFKTMAIPTTLLVNENGVVRWIDQADDYRLRGDARRITNALATAFRA